MRSSRMSFGARGVVALEEEQRRLEEVADEVEVEAPVEDNANSLETDLIDVADQTGEVEEVREVVEDGLDTVEALEGLREVCKAAAGDGGLNRSGAAGIRVSLEAFYARVGIKAKGGATPSLESFGGPSDRVRSTIALEADIGAKINQVWEAIKAAIQKAIEFVVNLFNKLFDGATKLQARAKKLNGQAEGVGTGAAPKQIDNERLAAALWIGAAAPNDAAGAKRLQEVLTTVYQDYPAMVDSLVSLADKATDASQSDAIVKGFGALTLGLDQVSNPSAAGFPNAEGMIVERSKELPGGMALVIRVPEADADVGKSEGGIAPFNPKATAPQGGKIGTMEKPAMLETTTVVGDIAAKILSVKGTVSKMTDAKKKLISIADKAAKASTDASEGAKLARETFKAVLNLMDKPFVSLNGYAINTGKALLDQVEESIKLHEAPAAKPAAEPAAAAA